MSVKWKRLITGSLNIDECRQYSYATRSNETLCGLFIGPGVVMSMAYNDGAELNFHGLEEKEMQTAPPDCRYYKLKKPLKAEPIRGTVINVALKDFLNIPIYILIKTD